VRAIVAALKKLDYEMIGELGHKMCGTGGGYGFPRITEIGASMDTPGCQRKEFQRRFDCRLPNFPDISSRWK
jgi:histidine phosphotransfer protein HptB